MNKILNLLQNIGRSIMIPIAMLPAAGILLAFGVSFQNPSIIEKFSFLGNEGVVRVLQLMGEAGSIIFANLPLLFAVGIAVGLTDGDGVAGLSAIVGFLIMNVTIGQFLGITPETVGHSNDYALVMGIPSLQTGVFGGIIMGVLASVLYKKYYKIKLPSALEFFSGKRFVPILTSFIALFIGIILAIIWPPIQHGINGASNFIMNQSLGLAAFLFGFVERLLIPFGLNHVWWPTFWLQFGEYIDKSGKVVHGDQLIFFAQLKDHVPITAGTFMAGMTPLKMFGIPAAALAMYRCADEKNKARVKGIMISGAITSMVCGITEPIEFSFLFVAPVLYGIHAVLSGLGFLAMYLLKVHIGLSFSGGGIDYLFFGILTNAPNWFMVIPFGLVMGAVYYFVFKFAILKWNLLTPGRGEEEVAGSLAVGTADISGNSMVMNIISAFGGLENMTDINACMSRLRINVIDKKLVNKAQLQALGAAGVAEVGNNIQAVFGMKSNQLKEDIKAVKRGDVVPNTMNEMPKADDEHEVVLTAEIIERCIDSFVSPCTGRLLPIEEIPDEVFRSKMMGDGFAVEITDSMVIAPFDGEIVSAYPTKHAIALKNDDGVEVLIHIGLDTVKLEGKGFNSLTKSGERVKKGDALVEVNIDYIKEQGLSVVSPIIFTNVDVDKFDIKVIGAGNVKSGEIGILKI